MVPGRHFIGHVPSWIDPVRRADEKGMKCARWLPASIAFVSVLSLARAAEPPSPQESWDEAVRTFAGVLGGSEEHEALDQLLSDHSWVAPFARNRTESVAVLPERLAGLRVVSARGCLQPSVTAASDLIADIRDDTAIAESIRRKLVPPEGQDLRHADSTMSRWFTTALDAQPGDPVALIALYDAGQANGAERPATPPSMTLLLIRGEFAGAAGQPRIGRVLYGTLEAAVR